VARLGLQRQVAHAQRGLGLLQLVGQHERARGGARRAGMEELWVEGCVQLVVERDHRAGQAGDEQENGCSKAEPAVQQDE
jgi:hypothetical protein